MAIFNSYVSLPEGNHQPTGVLNTAALVAEIHLAILRSTDLGREPLSQPFQAAGHEHLAMPSVYIYSNIYIYIYMYNYVYI